MSRVFLRIVILLAVLPCVLNGQSGILKGRVVDAVNGQGIPFAQVLLDTARYEVLADEEGVFTFNELPQGHYAVHVTRIGFTPRDTILEVTAENPAEIVIPLVSLSLLSDEVVVTAARRSQSIHLAPASASVVTSAQFNRRQITTFDQAVENVAGLTVNRTSGSNVQSLSIRGASETAGGGTGNRVLLLIDGRPALSPESGGALWNLVPLNSIERVEIVKGAYSALFGSSAMGGVINAITRTPGPLPETRAHLSFGVHDRAPEFTGYRRMGTFHGIELSHSRQHGRLGYLLDVGRKRNDGHRDKSSFTLYNIYSKLNYTFARNRTLTVSANFNKLDNDTPATWLSSQRPYSVAAHRKDDFQDKRERNLDVYYEAIPSSSLKYSSRFYFYDNASVFSFDDDPENDSTNVNIGKQVIDESTIDATRLGNVSQVDFTLGDAHYLLAGIDIKLDKTVALPDTVLYGRHRAVELGLFVQEEWTPASQLTITGGARLDHYAITGEFSETNFSPKVAMVYKISESLAVRGLFARAFRNPAIAERFIKFEQGGGLRFQPNPELVSEKLNVSGEAGLHLQLPGSRFTADVALYHNRYKDLISFVQISRPLEPLVFRVVNLNRAVMQGLDIDVSVSPFAWLGIRASYAYLDARDTSPGRFNDALAYKPEHTYTLATRLEIGKLQIQLDARGRSRLKEVFIYPDSKPDGYILWNTKWILEVREGATAYAAVNNLFDVQYEELERYRMAGRHFAVGLRGQF